MHPLLQCPAGAYRCRRRYLYPTDLRTGAVHDMDHAVRLSQPAPHQRNPAEERPGVCRTQPAIQSHRQTVSYQVDIARAYPQEANVKAGFATIRCTGKGFHNHRQMETFGMQRTECIKPDDLLRSRNRPQQNIILTGEAGRFKVEYDKSSYRPQRIPSN